MIPEATNSYVGHRSFATAIKKQVLKAWANINYSFLSFFPTLLEGG